jgi:hypothetical protein
VGHWDSSRFEGLEEICGGRDGSGDLPCQKSVDRRGWFGRVQLATSIRFNLAVSTSLIWIVKNDSESTNINASAFKLNCQ